MRPKASGLKAMLSCPFLPGAEGGSTAGRGHFRCWLAWQVIPATNSLLAAAEYSR
jgi:hypothetical protein